MRTPRVTPRLIAAYRRLMELEAMDLPSDDPRMLALGELAMLQYEITKAAGRKPWETKNPAADAFMQELRKAAKIDRATLRKIEAIEKREKDERIRKAEEWYLNGPHPWGWDQEKTFAEFEERYGYRPGERPD